MSEFTQLELDIAQKYLQEESFRMSNLYHLLDKNGTDCIFTANYNQQRIILHRR